MLRDDVIRIRYMVEADRKAQRCMAGRQRSDLDGDTMLPFAVVLTSQSVGETASSISPETRSAASSVPWARIVAMGNHLVHADVDIDHGAGVVELAQRIVEKDSRLLPPARRGTLGGIDPWGTTSGWTPSNRWSLRVSPAVARRISPRCSPRARPRARPSFVSLIRKAITCSSGMPR